MTVDGQRGNCVEMRDHGVGLFPGPVVEEADVTVLVSGDGQRKGWVSHDPRYCANWSPVLEFEMFSRASRVYF